MHNVHQHIRHVTKRAGFEVADPTVDYGVRPMGVISTPNHNNFEHHEWVLEMWENGRWTPTSPPWRLRNRDLPEFVKTRPWLRVVSADSLGGDEGVDVVYDGQVVAGGRVYTVIPLPGLRYKVIPEKGKVMVYDRDALEHAQRTKQFLN